MIIIYPMSDEEVGQCMEEPVGALGAHLYFPETVVEFSLQDVVVPDVPPGSTGITFPAITPQIWEREPPHPELVLFERNPYNDLKTARSIAASLKPFIGE